MGELVWEGIVEILREDAPSLKASAHLWRRDDFFGSDWGGQLDVPVVFRRLLPPGDYIIRLSSGAEARARIAGGPSTTSLTFPTVIGIGTAPFGANTEDAVTAPNAEANGEDVSDTLPGAEPDEQSQAVADEAVRPIHAMSMSAPTHTEPVPMAPPALPAAPTTSPSANADIDQTEALARAFLAAVEARQQMRAVRLTGFDSRLVENLTDNIDVLSAILEGALRARAGTARWPDQVHERVVVLNWFAAVASTESDLAAAARALHALVTAIYAALEAVTDAEVRRAA